MGDSQLGIDTATPLFARNEKKRKMAANRSDEQNTAVFNNHIRIQGCHHKRIRRRPVIKQVWFVRVKTVQKDDVTYSPDRPCRSHPLCMRAGGRASIITDDGGIAQGKEGY